ncbi:MAG: hypothetical protein J6Y04_00035 [Bacteroidaceae bacterium]|nr:hypothetical protein [Bacteroidaceae bacterium]
MMKDLQKLFSIVMFLLVAFIVKAQENITSQYLQNADDSGNILIDAAHFPDDNFRSYLLSQSYGRDQVLTEEEMANVTYMDVSDSDIQTLEGIRYFINLETFSCEENQLTTLNLSNNTALKYLDCYSNQLTLLNVSQCTLLTNLDCEDNQLLTLDVSSCTALSRLSCANNRLSSLIIPSEAPLTSISFYSNQLDEQTIANLVNSLPAVASGRLYAKWTSDDNIFNTTHAAVAKQKGWTPYYREGLSWKEMETDDVAYERALAAIEGGRYYRVLTVVGGTNYYLTADGYLTSSVGDAASFALNKVVGDEYEFGFQFSESYFTNPGMNGNIPILNSGHINTNPDARMNWEAQALFLNSNGKFAIRATNAVGGSSSWSLVAKTYWTVSEGTDGPLAEYSFAENYIWQIELDPSYIQVALNLVYDAEVVATKSTYLKLGSNVEVPAGFDNGLVSITQDVTTLGEDTHEINFYATWNGLFEFSDSYATAKWYNLTISNDYYVGMDEFVPYRPATDKELWDEVNQWAFIGTPYHLVIINRAAGAAQSLAVDGTNVVMLEGTSAWEAFSNSDGFSIRQKNAEGWVSRDAEQLQILNDSYAREYWECLLHAVEIPDRTIFEEMLQAAVAQAENVEGLIPYSAFEALQAVVDANNQEWSKIAQYNAAVKTINDAVELYASSEMQDRYSRYQTLVRDFEKPLQAENLEECEEGTLSAYQEELNAADEIVESAISVDDLNGAITEARASMRLALLALIGGVAPSEEHPLDISLLLENPDFEEGGEPMVGILPGWTCMFVKGETATNIGYMPNAYNSNGVSSAVGDAYVNGDVSIQHFMEAWQNNSGSRVIGDGKLYQTLSGLPVGRYRLTTDAIAVNQYDSSKNPVTGSYIYISSGQIETTTEIHTGNGLPEHFEVDFINDHAESLDFGLKTIGTTANWIAADNFFIYYVSELKESPGVASLKETLALYEDVTFGPCEQSVLLAFTAEREHAIEMTETDIYSLAHSSECIQEKAILQEKYDNVLASVEAYVTYQQSVNKVRARVSSVQDANSPLAQSLEELADELQQGIDEGNAVADHYQGIDTQISDLVNYWKVHFSEADMTILRTALQQMGSQPAWENRWNLDAEQLSLDGITNTEGRVTAVQLNGRGLTGVVPTALFALEKTSTFNFSGNRLSSIEGSVPSGKTLNIRNQQLDKVVNVNIGNSDASLLLAQLPSILCYQNSAGGATSHFAFNVVGNGYSFTLSENKGSLQVTSRSSYVYQGVKDAIMTCTSTYGDATGSTFSLRFTFDDGDANFDGTLDVLDLQTGINYIMEKYQSRPFNFTAANLWADDVINVQDVIRQINLLMEMEQPEFEGSVKRNAPGLYSSAEACLSVEDGCLILSTETPVAAFDIVVDGISELRLSAELAQSGIMCLIKNVGSGVRIIGYSLAEAVLPVGVSVIATLDEVSASVLSAKLADSEANAIRVKAYQQGLPTALDGTARQSADQEAIYDIQGRIINKNSYMPKGLYIQNGRKLVKK